MAEEGPEEYQPDAASSSNGHHHAEDGDSRPAGDGTFDVLFVGTGVSLGVPNMGHVLKGECETCMRAWRDPHCKDRRNNVSIAVMVNGTEKDDNGGGRDCVLVDAGKTMRDSIMRRFPSEGLRNVSALVLTHDHADAIFGLDDIRDLQHKELEGQCIRVPGGPMPVYLHQHTMAGVGTQFPYLTGSVAYVDRARHVVQRNVALLDWRVLPSTHDSFEAAGVPFRAFPLLHGGDYVCLGFAIGSEGELLYLSDVKRVPDETLAYLKSLPAIKTLVLDCLADSKYEHYSHFTLEDALALVDELRPCRCLLVGMCCSVSPHDDVNARLEARGYGHVQLAYDGMALRGLQLR